MAGSAAAPLPKASRGYRRGGFMHRNSSTESGDGSDGSPPSEAWLFAQAILGKPLPCIASLRAASRAKRKELERQAYLARRLANGRHEPPPSDAELRHQREILEWAAQISTKCESELRTLQWLEDQEREAWRRAEQFVELLLEDHWDPSKHPRLGGPPNAGWFATTGGTGAVGGAAPSLGTDFLGAAGNPRTTSYRADHSSALAMTGSSTSIEKAAAKVLADSRNRSANAGTPHQSGQDGDGSGNDKALTENDVLNYFKLLYGDKGEKLLRAFKKSGGLLKIEGLWFGKSALDTRNFWRAQQTRVHNGLNPIEAAQELMERLIDASGLTEVRQHLDHSGFRNIEALIASYKQAFKQAAAAVALASELYLSGISIVNEGADWVITIHELSEGNYYAAIGLLPLLPASVGKTGVVLKHGRQSLRISAETVRGIKALPVGQLIELLESTRKLTRNMAKAGIARPAGTAAHHIVPAGMKKFRSAEKARNILTKFGIGVEHAANGVYLPSQFDDAVKAAYHGSVHSRRYCEELYARLKIARSKEEVLIILNQIRRELLAGTFPH
jgi:hypothetical protein